MGLIASAKRIKTFINCTALITVKERCPRWRLGKRSEAFKKESKPPSQYKRNVSIFKDHVQGHA